MPEEKNTIEENKDNLNKDKSEDNKNEDKTQKFAAAAVSELKQINSLITQQGVESSVYDKMLPIINKHVKISTVDKDPPK